MSRPEPGAARGRCPERPSKPAAARASRREGSTPSPLRDEPLTFGAAGHLDDEPLTFGTAGHVDHGKTALVAALTGVDTDRLAEEKRRGLSIVLGYAPLELPSGRRVSVVDVPGHERFVRTMVAGASGVDAFLMVVAADDGVMPQTREHAEVLRGLGVERGVVAITKSDLADPARARAQAEELLPGRPVLACSARTGEGLARLRDALQELADGLPSRGAAPGGPRLHIDRSFTVRGRGTVVTGTLWAGAIAVGDRLELLPGHLQANVRAVEVHGAPVERARAGQRVAVNLRGVSPGQAARGGVLAAPGTVEERMVMDCALELKGARHGQRVQVHHGTRDVPGRLCELGGGLWQLRLERALLACDGDRLIVRRHAPPETLGGGVVVNAAAARHGRAGHESQGDGTRARGRARARGSERTQDGANPSLQGGRPDERLLAEVERCLLEAGTALLSEAQLAQAMGDRPAAELARALRALREDGRAVRVSGRLWAHAQAVAAVRRRVQALVEREGSASLAQARDELGVGRKAVQAFLEHMDAARVTRRLDDDRRVLGRERREG